MDRAAGDGRKGDGERFHRAALTCDAGVVAAEAVVVGRQRVAGAVLERQERVDGVARALLGHVEVVGVAGGVFDFEQERVLAAGGRAPGLLDDVGHRPADLQAQVEVDALLAHRPAGLVGQYVAPRGSAVEAVVVALVIRGVDDFGNLRAARGRDRRRPVGGLREGEGRVGYLPHPHLGDLLRRAAVDVGRAAHVDAAAHRRRVDRVGERGRDAAEDFVGVDVGVRVGGADLLDVGARRRDLESERVVAAAVVNGDDVEAHLEVARSQEARARARDGLLDVDEAERAGVDLVVARGQLPALSA